MHCHRNHRNSPDPGLRDEVRLRACKAASDEAAGGAGFGVAEGRGEGVAAGHPEANLPLHDGLALRVDDLLEARAVRGQAALQRAG